MWYDWCCVLCLYCDAWSCRFSCMGSMSVSSCICCMFVSCVHPVEVLNSTFSMTCSLLMLGEDERGDRPYGRDILQSRSRTSPCLFGGVLPYFEVTGIQFRFKSGCPALWSDFTALMTHQYHHPHCSYIFLSF